MSCDCWEKEAVNFLLRLVEGAIRNPLQGAGEELESILKTMGFAVERQAVEGDLFNLIVPLGENPVVLITAHYDTVPEEIEGLKASTRLEEGRFYGRGSCDALGSIAALLTALSWLKKENFNFYRCKALLAFTVDEEEDGRGSIKLAEGLPASTKWALVLEPTCLGFALTELGTLECRIKIKGLTAHGSMPEQGRNPLGILFRLMGEIEALVEEMNQKFCPSIPVVAVPLKVRGGSEALAIPAEAELKLDFRVPPEIPFAYLLKRFQELAGQYPGLACELLEEAPPIIVEKEAPFVRMLTDLYEKTSGEKSIFTVMPSWTDAHNLHARGIVPVIWGPGDLAVAHTDREYLELAELFRAAQFLAALLRHLGEF